MAIPGSENSDTILLENCLFSPSSDVVEHANITTYMQSKGFDDYEAFYKWSLAHRAEFWDDQARELHWFQSWDTTFRWTNKPFFQWFTGGKFNIVYNCLDRHMQTPRRTKVAYYWEADDGATRAISYEQLYKMTNQFAKGLQNLSVQKGDRVAIYLPMIPELPAAMLAVARLGAVHTVIFAGFAAAALRDRIIDAEAKVLITADGDYRGGKYINLKELADEAVTETPTVEKVVVVRRLGNDVPMQAGRDIYWDELVADIPEDTFVPCEPMDSEDPLFILYTVGVGSAQGPRTGSAQGPQTGSAQGTIPTSNKPKGVVHVQAGYAVGVYATTRFVFDVKEDDVYWCAADVGWVTGHSYVVYGPLMNGTTSVLFEGTPVYPAPDRLWRIIKRFKVNIFYTSPTIIRSLMRFGEEWPGKHDISSLRLLGTVGEPINPEAWMWYRHNIGRDKLPIMDTWWQTETGMILITPTIRLPLKPGCASRPFPTIEADVVDQDGQPVGPEKGGILIIRHPWPAQMRSIYRDQTSYETYWGKPSSYNTGDVAVVDKDGYFRIRGRVDDVIKVSGHHLGSMEIESRLVSHPSVAEAVAIGKPDPLKGEHIKVFVILKRGFAPSEELERDLKTHLRTTGGVLAVPDELEFTPCLPKTRSCNIMRRVIRSLELNEPVGDICC
jgi:acetyl-CoA synthetase